MRKNEAESTFRQYVRLWVREEWRPRRGDDEPGLSDFLPWLRARDASCLDFRSRVPVSYLTDLWFDQETGQAWKR